MIIKSDVEKYYLVSIWAIHGLLEVNILWWGEKTKTDRYGKKNVL